MVKRLVICFMLGLATTVAVAWGCALLVDPTRGRSIGSVRSGDEDWSYWVFDAAGATTVQRTPDWTMSILDQGGAMMTLAGIPDSDAARLGLNPLHQPQSHIEMEMHGNTLVRSAVPALPRWSAVHQPPAPHELQMHGTIIEDARGWPARALVSETRVQSPLWGSLLSTFGIANSPVVTTRWGICLRQPTVSSIGQVQLHLLPLRPLWPGLAMDCGLYSLGWILLLVVPGALRRGLRRRHGLCVVCGYDLRATVEPRCPECGAAVV